MLAVIDALLQDDQRLQASLREHVMGALAITDDDTDAIMWAPPRSLMLKVVPTLRRRLAVNWALGDGGHDLHQEFNLLPDFLPAALFSDLSLPEVSLAIPNVPPEYALSLLPAGQAIRELAPGRVTRRFAVRDGRPFAPGRRALSHWISPFPPDSASGATDEHVDARTELDIDSWTTDAEVVGQVDDGGLLATCFRPWSVHVSTTPDDIAPTSFGSLNWSVRLTPIGDPVELEVPRGAGVSTVVTRLDLFLHAQRSPVTVFRYSLGGHASVRKVATRHEESIDYVFRRGGAPGGVGFRARGRRHQGGDKGPNRRSPARAEQ